MSRSETSPAAAPLGTGKRLLFRLLPLALIVAMGTMAAEMLLRWRQARIGTSDALEPGLVEYDPDLGWNLTPGWGGRHQHHDFSARYAVSSRGFRADSTWPERRPEGTFTAVVGDSFTFGLGVNDDETFVHLLNSQPRPGQPRFANTAIPGFSTDQELLLLRKRIFSLQPDQILLVVYVGNDVIDNQLAIPMQIASAKPYFQLTGDALVLRNSPVPRERRAREAGQGGLLAEVFGRDRSLWPWRIRLEQRFALFQLLNPLVLPQPDFRAGFAPRLAPAVELTNRILGEITRECAARKIGLTIALMAGRSYFHQPTSVSGQYQEYLCRTLSASCRARGTRVIDLAERLRDRRRERGGDWFFPNDGHLNAAGHRAVAEVLGTEWTAPR